MRPKMDLDGHKGPLRDLGSLYGTPLDMSQTLLGSPPGFSFILRDKNTFTLLVTFSAEASLHSERLRIETPVDEFSA